MTNHPVSVPYLCNMLMVRKKEKSRTRNSDHCLEVDVSKFVEAAKVIPGGQQVR